MDQDTLAMLLARKVDKQDAGKMYLEKANKVEQENVIDSVLTLNKQLQHMCSLLTETINMNLLKGGDTE